MPVGDSLNLNSTGIFDGTSTGANGQVLSSTGTKVAWKRAADVFLEDNQTLLNKTLSSCTFNASLNTLTNIANASLINSSIEINGSDVSLGGSITIPDTNDNTIYAISVADGSNAAQKRIRLTAGGSGSGVQDIFLTAGYNTTITRSGNDTLTIATGLTQLRATSSNPYIEGQITIAGSGGTKVSQSGQIITIESDAFPIGGVIMWSGSINTIPAKWALCDGNVVNGYTTPDLRDRFIIGAGGNYSMNSTGGSKDAVVISHNHVGTTGTESRSHTHSGTSDEENRSHTHSGTTADNNRGHTHNGSTGVESAEHTHSGNTSNTGSHSHGGNTSNVSVNHTHSFSTSGASNNHTHYYLDRAYNFGNRERGDGNTNVLKNVGAYDIGRNTNGVSAGHYHTGNTSTNGGSHSHNISTDSSGSHSHTITTGTQQANHTHNFTTGGISQNHTHTYSTGNASQTHTHTYSTGNASQTHTHDITVSTEGESGTNKNLPPYYTLAFIVKVQ
jgi:hypothetical protein